MTPCRSMLTLFLLVAPTLAVAQTATVEVPGYGSVPLSDARATCVNGAGIGTLAGKGEGPRRAAVVEWGHLQLAAGPAEEGAWPQSERDLTYTDIEINWVPRGVVTSCWAVGRHDVATGLELRSLCDDDRAACRDAFGEAERDLVKDALRAKVKDRHDTMFVALSGIPDLATWQDPSKALERGCTWPQQAAAAGRFIDTDDLDAARASCLQLIELLTGTVEAEASALPCAGSWSQVPIDVAPAPHTDLGVLSAVEIASSKEVQLSMLRDKLMRMNPAAGGCDPAVLPTDRRALAAAFGATWNRGLVASYREAQIVRACSDDELPLADRLELCPDLRDGSNASCHRGDHEACDVLASMYIDGVGVEADEAAAFDVWQSSCNASHPPACEALKSRSDRIDDWFSSAIAASGAVVDAPIEDADDDGADIDADDAGLTEDSFARANGILASFGSALGPEWVSARAKQLFAAAIAAERQEEAGDIITLYGATLGEAWKTEASTELGALQKVLEKRSTP